MEKNKMLITNTGYIKWDFDEESYTLILEGDGLKEKDGKIIRDIIFDILLNAKDRNILDVDFEKLKTNEEFIRGFVQKIAINLYYFIFSTNFKNMTAESKAYYYKYLIQFLNCNDNDFILPLIKNLAKDISEIKDDIRLIKIALGDQDEED